MRELLEFLNDNNGVSILIASVSALISAIAVGIALRFNVKAQNHTKKVLNLN